MRTPMPLTGPDPEWTYGLGLRLWTDGSWGHTGTVEEIGLRSTRLRVKARSKGA